VKMTKKPKLHKLLSYILIVYLTFGSVFAVPHPVQASVVSVSNYAWYTVNPNATIFTISSADELRAFAHIVNGTDGQTAFNFSGRTVTLAANINLLHIAWIPIGTTANPFAGVFDGSNFTISGLQVNMTGLTGGAGDNAGLFGHIQNGTVQNLRVNGNVNGANRTGGIVGRVTHTGTGSPRIVNVHFSGAIIGGSNTGGIVGILESSRAAVGSSSNTANIDAAATTGGIVGDNRGIVETSFNTGNVTGLGDGVGGVVGRNQFLVQHSYNTGNVFAGTFNGGTGGVVGSM